MAAIILAGVMLAACSGASTASSTSTTSTSVSTTTSGKTPATSAVLSTSTTASRQLRSAIPHRRGALERRYCGSQFVRRAHLATSHHCGARSRCRSPESPRAIVAAHGAG